jgi:inner membrane protein
MLSRGMDPLTHAIVGAAIGYALCGPKLGRHAAGLGALAGMTPDLDHFVSSDADPLLYLEYHRYFTHSILFSLGGAFLPMLPWLLRRDFRARRQTLWRCAWPAYLSHCLLDASTTCGTQLYWPFARTRVSWDLISIVDPLFTVVLAIALTLGLARQSRGAVVFAIEFALAYLGFGAVQHGRAARVQRQLAVERGHLIESAEVMPTLANNVVWRSVYLANEKIYSDRFRVGWFSRGSVRDGTALPLMTFQQLSDMEREGNRVHRGYDRFAWFAGGWLARSAVDDTIIGDMRYSRSTEAFDPIWGIRFTKINERPAVEWISRERNRSSNVRELWDEISGADERFRKVRPD